MKKLLLLFVVCLFLIPFGVQANENYEMVYPFSNGLAPVVQNGKWGLLDEELSLAVPCRWDYIGSLSENRRLVKQGDLYGFLDSAHKTVIAPAYPLAGNFAEGLCAVQNSEGKWGYIDASGAVAIPLIYDEAADFSCGFALVKQDGYYFYINKSGKAVIDATLTEAYSFYEDRACIQAGESYGYINPTGEMVIDAEFELAFDFSEGAAVIKKGKYGLIDADGNILINPVWEQLSPQMKNGYLKGKKDGKWVFLDSRGTVLSKGFDAIGDFSEGFCLVKTDGGYGYIDETFSLVIPAVWESAGDFSGGYAVVSSGEQYGYIDKTGTPMTEMQYADAVRVTAGWGAVCEAETGYYFVNSQNFPLVQTGGAAGFETAVAGRQLLLKIDHEFMSAGGEDVPLDAAPILFEGTTMLPIRQVVEALGGQVEWEPVEKKISLFYESHSVVMYLGEAGAFVDGRFTLLSVPPMILNDRTLVPLRFATEALGCDVTWLPESREIVITY